MKMKVFFLILLGLCLQAVVIHDQGEPYPAIWAPGFVASESAPTSYTKPEFRFLFPDGDVEIFETSQILEMFPSGAWGKIADCFKPIAEDDARPERRLYHVLPGVRFGSYGREQRKPEVWRWFQSQADRLCDREDLIAVEVHWIEYSLPGDEKIGSNGVYKVGNTRAESISN